MLATRWSNGACRGYCSVSCTDECLAPSEHVGRASGQTRFVQSLGVWAGDLAHALDNDNGVSLTFRPASSERAGRAPAHTLDERQLTRWMKTMASRQNSVQRRPNVLDEQVGRCF